MMLGLELSGMGSSGEREVGFPVRESLGVGRRSRPVRENLGEGW